MEWGSKPEDGALTVLQSNNGKKPAKKGAKASPPATAARAGMTSPACSSNMASYSACGAKAEAEAQGQICDCGTSYYALLLLVVPMGTSLGDRTRPS